MVSRRGRPPFKPTAAQRRKVSQSAAAGWTHNRIAAGIGCDDDTLRKHFAVELEQGGAKHSIEALDLLWKQARSGNVTATKKLIDLNDVGAAAVALRDRETAGGAAAPRPAEKLGKKEEQQRAAEQISGLYAVPASPKLVVNNE